MTSLEKNSSRKSKKKQKPEKHQNQKEQIPLEKSSDFIDYYSILGLSADCSPIHIREAYFRLKSTYSSNSEALYSLVSDIEVQDTVHDLEEAFRVLADTQSREVFHKKWQLQQRIGAHTADKEAKLPLAEPPAVGHSLNRASVAAKKPAEVRIALSKESIPVENRKPAQPAIDVACGAVPVRKSAVGSEQEAIQSKIKEVLASQDMTVGCKLVTSRNLLNVSLDEIKDRTKIGMDQIIHLETDIFDCLPPVVYVKGFLKSYLNYLGVHDSGVIASLVDEIRKQK